MTNTLITYSGPMAKPNPRNLPAINKQCVQFERNAERLRKLFQIRVSHPPYWWAPRKWDKKELEEVKELLPQMQALLKSLNRPASKEEIAAAVALLTASFPSLQRAEVKHFTSILCEDLNVKQPTLITLLRACRVVRQHYEFLSVKALMTELKRAKRDVGQIEFVLEQVSSLSDPKHIKSAERHPKPEPKPVGVWYDNDERDRPGYEPE